jgi:hypothetical protein
VGKPTSWRHAPPEEPTTREDTMDENEVTAIAVILNDRETFTSAEDCVVLLSDGTVLFITDLIDHYNGSLEMVVATSAKGIVKDSTLAEIEES